MISQKLSLTGDRNQKVKRPELVERHGFDVKFAYQALRLGFQGYELITTGNITLPMRDQERETLLALRRGQIDLTECLELINNAEDMLRAAVDECDREADFARINNFLVQAHSAMGHYG